ncbi:hypothetical protein L0156_24440 [bacterium]|nr:hypothetical protein [bacterium]
MKIEQQTLKKMFLLCVILYLCVPLCLQADSAIKDVKISRPFFNPGINENIAIEFQSAVDGSLTLLVLDRDAYLVRTLAKEKWIAAGEHSFIWNGRSDEGTIVPDEAYSIHMELISGGKTFRYAPAEKPLGEVKAEVGYYDRQNKILTYKLPEPARVHIQAGSAVVDPKTGKGVGPVLRTLVNREAKTSGALIQHWTGYDESNSIYVPDLPNFVFSIFATALPENSILTTANRNITFVDSIAGRKGEPLYQNVTQDHHHHSGLTTLSDISPPMILTVNATWSDNEKAWIVKEKVVEVTGRLEGPTVAHFIKQPGSIGVFVNNRMVSKIEALQTEFLLKVPVENLSQGFHYIAINAGSEFGPVSTNSFRIKISGRKKS